MSSTLLSIDHSRYGFVANAFNNSREIGHFSVDAQRQMHYDKSQMKYYVPRSERNLPLDLTVGYEDAVRKEFDTSETLNQLLRWIIHSKFEPLKGLSVDFVCARGTIQKLLCTPFCPGYLDHWIICACRVGDVIYLTYVDSDEKIKRERAATEEQKQMSAWGYKFEQYMTAADPHGHPDVLSNTHEMEEFCVIVKNTLGTHNLLMRAEVDGVNKAGSVGRHCGKPSPYVELKTSKMVPNFPSSYQFKKFKSLKWWAQSVIIGIKENICGLRDENGIVRSIVKFNTEDLPQVGKDFWDKDFCVGFCNNFLKYLKLNMRSDHSIVYKFEYVGNSEVFVTKLRNPVKRYQVIPDWYLTELQINGLY